MKEIKLKKLVMFILETLVIMKTNNIDMLFAVVFNNFIYKCYNTNKEELEVIYDLNILKQFIDNNYEILSLDQISKLLNRYHGFDGYVNLLEEIGLKEDLKINKLASAFAKYYFEYKQELIELYNADPNQYYPKGFTKILQ